MSELNLDYMRTSGRILAEALHNTCYDFISPGMSASCVSKNIEKIILSYRHAEPAFLGYNGFPASACVSINNEVVHTIPREDKIIQSGDIVSVDCGVKYMGHYTDACRTVAVGEVDKSVEVLISTTEEALVKGSQRVLVGGRVSDISHAIQRHVERRGLKVHLEFSGHGIGLNLHQAPCVPNYGPSGRGDVIKEGMCLAVEPVVFMGKTDSKLLSDGWTVVSKNGNLSAHFEDTIIATLGGPEIITR